MLRVTQDGLAGKTSHVWRLKASFARASTAEEKKKLASQIQAVALETATHAPLGQYRSPTVIRSNVSGILQTPGIPAMWNIKKN